MKEYQSLSHTRWDCKYHVVFIPKRRKKRIFGELRRHLGEMFRDLAGHKESKIVEGHLMGNHVHMCISIPRSMRWPMWWGISRARVRYRLRVSLVVGNAIFTGENFWARGYFVSTVGLDEHMVRAYIRNQEVEDERYEQMKLGAD